MLDAVAVLISLVSLVMEITSASSTKLEKQDRQRLRDALRDLKFDPQTIATLENSSRKVNDNAAIRLRDTSHSVAEALKVMSCYVADNSVALRLQILANEIALEKRSIRAGIEAALREGRASQLGEEISDFNRKIVALDLELNGAKIR